MQCISCNNYRTVREMVGRVCSTCIGVSKRIEDRKIQDLFEEAQRRARLKKYIVISVQYYDLNDIPVNVSKILNEKVIPEIAKEIDGCGTIIVGDKHIDYDYCLREDNSVLISNGWIAGKEYE